MSEQTIAKFAPKDEDDGALKCDPSDAKSMTKEERDINYRKLVFATAFFYSELVERRKFGTLGFNIRYPFSQSDFETSITIL